MTWANAALSATVPVVSGGVSANVVPSTWGNQSIVPGGSGKHTKHPSEGALRDWRPVHSHQGGLSMRSYPGYQDATLASKNPTFLSPKHKAHRLLTHFYAP